ncbi:MAG: RNA-binding protein [Smithellaceae bacterium]|nr:RNA-binding protein [Smithellaceae bacterium]
MIKKLYIGNLTSQVREEDLLSNFKEAGAVISVAIIKDRMTGYSKGFGFVEMETIEGAQEAIKMFNGGNLDGNTIVVNEAKPPREQGGTRPYQGGGKSNAGGYRGGFGGRSGRR